MSPTPTNRSPGGLRSASNGVWSVEAFYCLVLVLVRRVLIGKRAAGARPTCGRSVPARRAAAALLLPLRACPAAPEHAASPPAPAAAAAAACRPPAPIPETWLLPFADLSPAAPAGQLQAPVLAELAELTVPQRGTGAWQGRRAWELRPARGPALVPPVPAAVPAAVPVPVPGLPGPVPGHTLVLELLGHNEARSSALPAARP